MRLPKFSLITFLTFLIVISLNVDWEFLGRRLGAGQVLDWQFVSESQVLAQTPDERKAEADRLLWQGINKIHNFEGLLEEGLFQGLYFEGFNLLQEALKIYQKIGNRQGQWHTLSQIVDYYSGIVNYDFDSDDDFNSDYFSREDALSMVIGELLNTITDDHWQQFLELARERQDRQAEQLALLGLGRHSEPYEAIDYYQQSLAIAQERQDRQGEQLAWQMLRFNYFLLEENTKSIKYFQQFLELARELQDHDMERIALERLGFAYFHRKDYPKAKEYFQQLLELARELQDDYTEESALRYLDYVEQVLAQPADERKAELYQLLYKGIQQVNYAGFSESLEGRRSPEQPPDAQKVELDQLENQAYKQYDTGQLEAALQSWQRVLTIYREMQDPQGEGYRERYALKQLGDIYYSLENYAKAIEYFEEYLVFLQEVQVSLLGEDRENVLCLLGNAYSKVGNYAKAIDYHQQYLVLLREKQIREIEFWALHHLPKNYFSLRDYTKAIDYSQQLLVFSWEMKDLLGGMLTLASLESLGEAYSKREDYAKAIDYFEQILVFTREMKDPLAKSLTLRFLESLGEAYSKQEDYTKAIDYFEQLLVLARELQDHPIDTNVVGEMDEDDIWEQNRQKEYALVSLGEAYSKLGNYDKAIDYYQQYLTLAREALGSVEDALLRLADTYFKLENYAKAIDYYQQSLATKQAILEGPIPVTPLPEEENPKSLHVFYEVEYYKRYFYIAQPRQNCKELSHLAAYSAEAIEYYQQQLSLARETENHQAEVSALWHLGEAYSYQGNCSKAIDYAKQSLTLAQEQQDPYAQIYALNLLARIYTTLANYAQAIEYDQQILALAREIKNNSGEKLALDHSGLVRSDSGNLGEFERMLRNAINLVEGLRQGPNYGFEVQDKNILIDSKAIAGMMDKRVTDKDPKIYDRCELTIPYSLLQTVLVAQNKPNEALEVAEQNRARAFAELIARRLSSTPNQPPVILPPKIKQIQQIAQEQNATLVEYSIVYSTLYIWVIQPTGEVTLRTSDLQSLHQQQNISLEDLVFNSRESIGVRGRGSRDASPDASKQTQSLQQLHQLLIQPIADLLPTDPNAHVIFIPHGSLFLVPFPALQDANYQYLIEKHTIRTAPSIQSLSLTRQSRQELNQKQSEAPTRKALVVGNPTMPQIKVGKPPELLEPLPGAEKEAKEIAQLLNTQPLIGNQATESAIVQQMPSATIIHLATHGLIDDLNGVGAPGAIALATSGNNDGFLTTDEIMRQYGLPNTPRLNAELAVLSACDTGRGKITGDGVIGLSRSLIAAGVPSVVVSLWKVPDNSTATLMTEFYTNFYIHKLDKAQALRQAMLKMMEEHPDPKDWAAFTLIGEAE